MTRLSVFAILTVFAFGACRNSRDASEGREPAALLREADRLAWLTDWYGALPLYVAAEELAAASGDRRSAMHAKFGRLRGQMQTLALADVSREIARDIESPLAKADRRLTLRGLTVKGDIDLEWDVEAAHADWERVRQIASELGDKGWEHRATGELGLIAFMRGNTGEARTLVERAFRAAWWSGDIGGQLRYLGATSHGLLQAGYPQRALEYADKAIAFASKHRDTGFPYVAYSTKVLALLRLNRPDEAERLVHIAMKEATAGDRRIKQVELLMILARIAEHRGDGQRAVEHLEEAVDRAPRWTPKTGH